METTWMARGSCANSNPEVFFPHDGIGVEIAKQICIGCTVTAPVSYTHLRAHETLR